MNHVSLSFLSKFRKVEDGGRSPQACLEMNAKVSNFLIQTLCDNQGSLDFRVLTGKVEQTFPAAAQVLHHFLSDKARIAVHNGILAVAAGQICSQDSVIVAKTSLRICQKKPGECLQCENLHLCKFYVLGTCTFGLKCKCPHNLTWPHNVELLKKHDLLHLSERQLFQMLLQNDPYLLPEICSHYNMGEGVSGLCKFTSTCHKLHICKPHFTTGVCKLGPSCSRIHDVNPKVHKSFEKFSPEMIASLPKVYKNKSMLTDDQKSRANAAPEYRGAAVSVGATKDSGTKEICLFFLKKQCTYKEKCRSVHWHLPYRWQVLDEDCVTWKDLRDMEKIEKAYCDPTRESSIEHETYTVAKLKKRFLSLPIATGMQSVDFMSMTSNGSPVRRLSTASSVTKASHFSLTTQWLWYWMESIVKWQEYGQSQVKMPDSLTSEALEKFYSIDQKTQISFTAGGQQYVIYFKNEAGTLQMYQENIKYLTKREVRRRPRFVSSKDVEVMLTSSGPLTEQCPPHWDKNALPDIGYKLVPLPKSPEYDRIECLFKATMPKSRIHSINRIQNPLLWTSFQLHRDQMKKRNGGKPVIEQYLFHGTNDNLIAAICEQNFDWRMSGVHGTAFGKGSYFAKQASYSNRYATVRNGNKSMFVALVLVGDYIKGSSQYARPPAKPSIQGGAGAYPSRLRAVGGGHPESVASQSQAMSLTLYDSCVDDEKNPTIFVIFERQQIYPEYIIQYSE